VIWLLLAGLLSLVAQVVVLRELGASLYGVELIYLLALSIWMLSTAAGAAIARRVVPSDRSVRVVLLLAGVALPLTVVAVRSARWLLGAVPGAFLPFPLQIATVAMAVVPVGCLLGLLFQWAAARAIAEGRTAAMAYALEALGALVGGVVVTTLVREGASTLALALGACGLALALPISRMLELRRRRWVWRVCALAMLAAPLAFSSAIDRRLASWNHPDLLDLRDTPYSRIVVTGRAGQVAVLSNEVLVFDSESAWPEAFAGLAALSHPAPRRALVLGGALNGVARELAAYVAGEIDNVELDRAAYETVQARLPDNLVGVDRRVHVVFADPRAFLRAAGSEVDHGRVGQSSTAGPTPSGPYDVILVATPEPSSGETSRYYTQEFFALCRRTLAPGGVVGLRLPAAENVWTPALAHRTASIYRALKLEFPDVLVIPGPTLTLLASPTPLTKDPDVLVERLRERGARTRLLTPAFIRYLLTNDRQAETTRLIETTDAPTNTDSRPACYQYAAVVWLSMFYPRLAATSPESLAVGPRSMAVLTVLLCVAAIGLAVVIRRRLDRRLVVLVALIGAAGMVLETMLILRFQIVNGVVYQDIGLLLSSFMAGLAAGAFAIDRLGVHELSARDVRRWGWAILSGLGLIALSAPWMTTGANGGLAAGVALGATGAIVGAGFGYATLRWPRDRARGLGALYAADLVGGCLGTLAAALVLVPQAGVDQTAMAAAALAAVAMLFI
jgi:spermidine synthase